MLLKTIIVLNKAKVKSFVSTPGKTCFTFQETSNAICSLHLLNLTCQLYHKKYCAHGCTESHGFMELKGRF